MRASPKTRCREVSVAVVHQGRGLRTDALCGGCCGIIARLHQPSTFQLLSFT